MRKSRFSWNKPQYLVNLRFGSAEVGVINASTVVVRFSRQVKATNPKTGVTITVAGAGATISTGTIQADKRVVYYALSAPVTTGQAVTIAYDATTGNILDYVTSVALPTTAAQTVTNNVLTNAGYAMGVLGLTYSGNVLTTNAGHAMGVLGLTYSA